MDGPDKKNEVAAPSNMVHASKDISRWPTRWLWRLLRLTFFFMVVIFVVGAGGLFYLLDGDQEMDWLRARIEKTLNERGKGAVVIQLASAKITVEDDVGAVLQLEGFDVADKAGRFFAASDTIRIIPDWFSLLSGSVEVKSVTLDGAAIRFITHMPVLEQTEETTVDDELSLSSLGLDRAKQADLSDIFTLPTLSSVFGFSSETTIDGDEPELVKLLEKGLAATGKAFDQLHQLGLGTLDIRNVAIEVLNEKRELLRDIQITSAVLSESTDVSAAHAQQHIIVKTKQDNGGVEVKVSHVKKEGGDERAFLFDVSNIVVSNFIKKLTQPDYPIRIDLPFSTNGSVVLKGNHSISRFDAQLIAGKGSVTTAPKSMFNVSSGALNLTLNHRTQSIVVTPSPFLFGRNQFVVEGNIKLPTRLLDPYPFELYAKDTFLASPDVNTAPVVVDLMEASGAMQPRTKVISVSDFTVKTGTVNFSAAVSFGFGKTTPSMALAAEMSPIPVRIAKQLWPIFIAPSARGWVLKNVHKGVIEEGRVTASIPAGVLGNLRKGATMEPDELALDFIITDAAFSSFGGLPDIENARVRGKTRGISFTADLEEGAATSTFGGEVTLESGSFHIGDTRFIGPIADIKLKARGDADDIGAIADSKPVRALSYASLKPKHLTGSVFASVDVSLPLRGRLTADEISWKADLDVRNFTSSQPVDGRTIEKASAAISLVPSLMTIKGEGVIDGIHADIDLEQPLSGKGKARSVAVKVVLSDEDRNKLGLDLGDYLRGPVVVEIDQDSGSGTKGDVYRIDLSRAEIRLDFIGWRKAKGILATARMQLLTTAKGTKIRNFELSGDGFGARGDVDLSPKGEIERLILSKLALKPGDDIAVEAVLKAERTYDIALYGEAFDARSLIRVLTESSNNAAEDSFRYKIRASLGRITGYLSEVIRNLNFEVSLRGATVLRLQTSGLTKGARIPFEISYGAVKSRGDILKGSGPDAGALARFSNVYYRAFGGAFNVSGLRPTGAKALGGKFKMTRFHLVDEPALSGLSATRDSKGRASVKFNILDVNFSEEDQRLTIKKGLLSGDNIGGTYEGVLDRKTKSVNFTGTYVPIYVLNNFFTKIPLFGQVLGNGKREGLIGVTFKVVGKLGDPRVTVNPLSVLAPGFLRQLFKFRKAQGQTN